MVEGAGPSDESGAENHRGGEDLRRKLSVPEAMLWSRLRRRSPDKPAFRRQHPIGPYILDFYCASAKLAVEIDGRAHEAEDRPERDARRDAWLLEQEVVVVRIPASVVLTSADATADGILRLALATIAAQAPSTALTRGPPPPLRRGG